MKKLKYAGFWIRFVATLIDSFILLVITAPPLFLIYGQEYFLSTSFYLGPADLVLSYIFPVGITIFLWMKIKGTPGKKILGIEIIDAKTSAALSLKQSIIRYVGYFLMTIPFCLGFVLIAWHTKKQGWHDKLAKSLVIYKK